MAQDAGDQSTELDEVVVTGSLIRRDPANAATPLILVTQEQLLSTGQTTLVDYLAKIPALSNSTTPADTTGSNLNDGGLSFANLRSLGTGRTLTLVNGRRHVGSSAGSLAVDVDSIPRLLIQEIQIVTGGASAIYGADAVSGVLNFITRDDYEGLQFDANYGMINEGGQATRRFSALGGKNFFDDRLNVYLSGEYEQSDEVQSMDVDWLKNASVLIGVDNDSTTNQFDGEIDQRVYTGVNNLSRPRWGQTTIANAQQPSSLSDPDVPLANCTAVTSANCYSVDPAKTYWFDGTTARLADFGERVGNTGSSRPFNYGGDGESNGNFNQVSRVPYSESQRYQTGFTFDLTEAVTAYGEAKYITEDTYDVSQPTFFDVYLNNGSTTSANQVNVIRSSSTFDLRLDNAFLPENLRSAILANSVTTFSNPTDASGGVATGTTSRAWARHSMFGPDRTQTNNREIQRYVLGFRGEFDDLLFLKNVSWDVGYNYGRMDNVNNERGVDSQRFAYAADAVVDTAGLVGQAGSTVCRIQLINAQNPARATGAAASTSNTGALYDYQRGGDLRDTEYGRNAISECQPLNIFGAGNQSQAALDYIDASINVRQKNEQQQGLATISGQLWDFWGAGAIGLALGVEHRSEYTEGIGRSADTAGRLLFLNTGADFEGEDYTSDEIFAEVSVPLFTDSRFGEFAELSGSYRVADYSTVGKIEAYGGNLVYRPVQDITFKSSLNVSVRVPSLSELYNPNAQTFFNNVSDPCATSVIATQGSDIKANRIANCTTLAAAKGLTYDFAGATSTNTDDYVPVYSSGVAGVSGGNANLKPEQSDSFTFSTVLRPRMVPNLTLALDYYSIEISDVIASVSAQTLANNCVNGPTLNNTTACNLIYRNNAAVVSPTTAQERSEAFKIGAPSSDAIGGFLLAPINYAAYETSGIDFTVNYAFDTREMLDRPWGAFNYSLRGTWLRKQDYYTDAANPEVVTASAGTFNGTDAYPRVRYSSSLTWQPLDDWRFNWTADWQAGLEILDTSNNVGNIDTRAYDDYRTESYVRNDFTVNWSARENVDVRFGVVNAFDAEQDAVLGNTQYDNYDNYGRRFFIGLNYRPW